ncbi:hypothetical protein LSH36_56g04029 [Paralvinella palmiformis]|uniref:RNA transcription, translation and transport factor protein n=1 Tax=Paralvinella palmiformis TaxID=53620 RepID=A0AAD9K6G5_9ANNE|nr:hypothetical protein LSH36_56g04029 [Paralvinella palmiformis]
MFRRKLLSLDFTNPNKFNYSDESQYRNLIIWIEDQKIRHYKIDDRKELRDICSGEWQKSFKKYLDDLECPHDPTNRTATLDWLLGYAVRLEYGDKVNDPDFKAGVTSLASLLQIPPHADHLTQLKAICILVKERLSKDALDKLKKEGIKHAESVSLDRVELGFETSDYITTEAAKILRMLHIKELRDLQNSANQAIVLVQQVTANPKTDTKLGKVGRS